jgi:long-chain acyl-CoA synthetase
VVARPIKNQLGGRLRLVVSGGAALPLPIAQVFIGLGIPLLQGYGLTESSPQVSVNRLSDNDPSSVGAPLPGVQVRVGDQDELQVLSPGNMLGYWENPEATAAIFSDGWLRTGDQASIREGRIYITGRLKDVLVLSNGEKVPPAEMELSIALDPLVDQIMIVGEGRPFLSAIVVLNPGRWQVLAQRFGLDPSSPASLSDRQVQHEVLAAIGSHLRGFPSWAKVRRAHLSLEPWSVDNGLLTPTLKTKRRAVLDHYAEVVEWIYDHAY